MPNSNLTSKLVSNLFNEAVKVLMSHDIFRLKKSIQSAIFHVAQIQIEREIFHMLTTVGKHYLKHGQKVSLQGKC